MPSQTTKDRTSLFILVTILIIAAVVHAQNLFQFPYYQDAEGTAIANGWALLTRGQLAPYTYAYNEPPAGALIMSVWLALSGGLSTFGFAINSGRVLMLILHLLTTGLLYGIARKISRSDLVAIIATLLYAFSPLAADLQRQVLLDNIMLVWLLGAFYLIIGDKRRLSHYCLSAMLFGLAVLTKGAALFLLPAFIYTIRLKADVYHKRFATNLWLALFIFLVMLYPLYAQMKQELFPRGWALGGDFPHVSLIERLADRGPETGRFLNIGSGVMSSFRLWVDVSNVTSDAILIYGGLISTLFVIVMSIDQKALRPLVAILIMYGVFLLFGGQIFTSDADVLLPFLAINIGLLAASIVKLVARAIHQPVIRFALTSVVLIILLYPFWIFDSQRLDIYVRDQVNGQLTAVNWLKANVSPNAVVVADNYAFVDLRETLANAQHYWKVDTDPDIKFNVLHDNPCNIDYILSTPQVFADIATFHLDLMKRAIDNSTVLVTYSNNGWPVAIRQMNKQNCADPTANTTVAVDLRNSLTK